jgi:toxin ParE1/3/4
MSVEWTDLALADIGHAVAVVARDSVAATALAQRLWAAATQLGYQPMAGRPGRVERTRECALSEVPYMIVYTLAAGQVVIVRVLPVG